MGDQKRVTFIDNARGMLIVWMVIAHALTVARLDPNDLMQYLRPPGWATSCFITLTGFTIAVLFNFDPKSRKPGVASKLVWRAVKIGMIAFLSNLFFKFASACVSNSCSFDYFLRVLTFQEPWSISAFLVPTVLFLFVAPAVIRVATGIAPWKFLSLVTATGVLFDVYARLELSRNKMLMTFLGPMAETFTWIEILFFFLFGLWGFAFGNMLKKNECPKAVWTAIVCAAASLLLVAKVQRDVQWLTEQFMLPCARFIISMEIVLLLKNLGSFLEIEKFIGTLGRSALLIFILHRPLIQAGGMAFGGLMPDRALALELMAVALLCCFWIAFLRYKNRSFSTMLNAVGL